MDILLISEEGVLTDNLVAEMENNYDIQFARFEKSIFDTIEAEPQKLILVFLNNLSAESERVLNHLVLYGKSPIAVCGTRPDCRQYIGEKFSLIYKFIFTPIPLKSFMHELRKIWNQINGVKENPIQEEKKEEERKKILLVDDDPVTLRTVSVWLKNDYDVAVVKSGAACLTYLGKARPDLILLDYDMPVMSGTKTLEAIRTEDEFKDIPVVFLTAVADVTLVQQAVQLKPQGYILKSQGAAILLEKLHNLFDLIKKED